ncbi:MAG TPA: 4-(cytidine 5'-diphospho)-2-C-methyl-D-erythritol kinase [Candidatus Kapabacteria bacterium]|nr:4-(cytidine 5'-diphospho)-2-C-methyl-D-erythritol kinase [Candidatus Kapabacteria bacterium]
MAQVFHSHCKINLGLEILRKRPDGYHDINTLFYRLDGISDSLIVSGSAKYELEVRGLNVPADSNNLVTKAIEACARFAHIDVPKLRIVLEKKIPAGAGLGGGSANAAKAIEIFSASANPLSEEEKFCIARSLGADVPFFLMAGKSAVASGIGDILTPVSIILPYTFLIVKPRTISISTTEAYSKLEIPIRDEPTDFALAAERPLPQWRNHIVNDFESVAFKMAPSLRVLKGSLYDHGANFALMSGSGSAFLAVFAKREVADQASDYFTADTTLEVFLSE